MHIASRQEDRDGFTPWLASRPEDDEPLTPQDEEAIAQGRADITAGRLTSLEEIKREFGYESARHDRPRRGRDFTPRGREGAASPRSSGQRRFPSSEAALAASDPSLDVSVGGLRAVAIREGDLGVKCELDRRTNPIAVHSDQPRGEGSRRQGKWMRRR